jgi:hypothetical protein
MIIKKVILLNIDDSVMVAGSESFQAALVFYNSAKVAAERNVQLFLERLPANNTVRNCPSLLRR